MLISASSIIETLAGIVMLTIDTVRMYGWPMNPNSMCHKDLQWRVADTLSVSLMTGLLFCEYTIHNNSNDRDKWLFPDG